MNYILINHGLYMYKDQILCKYYSVCVIVYFITDTAVENFFIIKFHFTIKKTIRKCTKLNSVPDFKTV